MPVYKAQGASWWTLACMPCTCLCCCGACCEGSVCSQTLPENCTGEFLGRGVPCDPNPCLGVCCTVEDDPNSDGVIGVCQETTEAECGELGGDWYDNVTCEYAPCSCDCSDPGWSVSFSVAGTYTFPLGQACVFPAHIQVTITDDDGTRTENYISSGGSFTVEFGDNATVEMCVNPDVVFDCDPDDGCTESETGTLTYQECVEQCVEGVRCIEDVGCVTAYDTAPVGYATLGECEDDCAWANWVGDGPKPQAYTKSTTPHVPKPPRAKRPKPVRRQGAGAVLKSLLATIGITTKPGCKCNQRARTMDDNGIDWCAANIPQIVDWLEEEHKRQKIKLPFSKLIAGLLVRYAIRRARAINKGEKK